MNPKIAFKYGFNRSLLILMLVAVFSSCNDSGNTKQAADVENKYSSWACKIKVVEIDSCQYLVAQTGALNGGMSIVHKQNCKYCAGRNGLLLRLLGRAKTVD